MNNIAVIGGGTMGNGIAHTAAASGFDVTLVEIGQDLLDRAIATISANLQRGVDKGRMSTDEKQSVLKRIKPTTDIRSIQDADIVIEAILENLAAKTQLFEKLDKITGPKTILASDTSSISITKIAAVTKRPDQVIGMHFMNPVPVMTLVEVIRGMATSDETYRHVETLAKKMGKTPIEVNDYPRVHIQSGLDADDQRGDLHDVRGCGHGGGDRRSDEAGDESPNGAAGAC